MPRPSRGSAAPPLRAASIVARLPPLAGTSPRFPRLMTYAIISLGGKQYRVQEGERLLVDRVSTDEGQTFHPSTMLVGGNGEPNLDGHGVTVTARVVGHVLGDKIRSRKYRPQSGFRQHTRLPPK